MRKRAKVSGARAKARRPKAAKQNRRAAPKAASRLQSLPRGSETEVARLAQELNEAREQQRAALEVLQVIAASPSDTAPVFEAIAHSANRLLAGFSTAVWRFEGELAHLGAFTPTNPQADAALRALSPLPIRQISFAGGPLSKGEIVQIPDTETGPEQLRDLARLRGYRAMLFVPLTQQGSPVGFVSVTRKAPGPFDPDDVTLLKTFAAQAVIAIENARLLKELHERTDQLAAQSQELAELNQKLEQRVSDQVDEIERMGRLRRFLPPQVADLIVASGTEKQLESHRREISALFCDLRGFTGFTESADAEDVMALLRDYHAAIGQIVIKYNGTLERYAGDGVMVIFNDPVPVENPALQAVLMALELREAIGALTDTWRRLGHDIGFGIGIAHGFATLGTIGFEGRFDYAAIGTVSNVASRLCDEAKPGQILISPGVLMNVENAVKVEPVGEFELKGIRRPLAAYNVLSTNATS